MLHVGSMVSIRNKKLLCVDFFDVLVTSEGPCGPVFYVYILFVSYCVFIMSTGLWHN